MIEDGRRNRDQTRPREGAKSLALHDQFPFYRQIMAREGIIHAADLAVIGHPEAVIGQLLWAVAAEL